jgi:hypothetical protein
MSETYTEDRFYKSTLKFLTEYVETVPAAEADPKLVAEIVKMLDKVDISTFKVGDIPSGDPAAKRAAELKAKLNK